MKLNSAKRLMTGVLLGFLLVPAAYAAENESDLTQAGLTEIGFTDGGSGVGSGGDYIRQLFEQSRQAAVAKVGSILPCALSNVSPEIANWITTNRDALARDIQASPHLWVVDTQDTCAFTDHSPNSALYLSYPTCNNTTNTPNASLFVLIHESAHHLGVADEKVADAIANAVMNAPVVKECPTQGSPFDTNICQGSAFSAADAARYLPRGSLAVDVGSIAFYTRARFCTVVSGCQDWKEAKLWRGGKGLPQTMQMTIETANIRPYFSLRFAEQIFRFAWQPDFSVAEFTSAPGYLNQVEGVMDSRKTIPLKGISQRFTGAARSNCLWYQYKQSDEIVGGRQETEIVFYGRY
jgi:hypothetical protein